MTSDGRQLLGVVLAGGASTRFGSPKWNAEVGGRSMGARAVTALSGDDRVVVVVGSDPDLSTLGVDVRPDDHAGRGPLEGIATGLRWARELHLAGTVVLACDLPLIRGSLVDMLVDSWTDEDAVVPESVRGVEPLCALYARSALPTIELALERGERSPMRVLESLVVRRIRVQNGADELDFMNVNTRSERALAEAEQSRREGQGER